MLSSLKAYKGTKEFLSLAEKLPAYKFELVINDTPDAIESYLQTENILPSANITIHSRTSDVSLFYNSASIVLNLSNPDLFIETFGLTALEAMSAALPVIVPPVGGIAEMVTDGVNGYKIDCRDTETLMRQIVSILTNKVLYLSLAQNAYSFSTDYTKDHMLHSIISIIRSND